MRFIYATIKTNPTMKNIYLLAAAILISLTGFSQLKERNLTTSKGLYIGFYEYVPTDYVQGSSKKYPTIIFLHGLGERGNGTTQLNRVLKHGVPKNIAAGHPMKFYWNGKWESFIVLAPQLSGNYGSWQTLYVDEMIKYAKENLPVDLDRIHLTGLSLGGGGTWSFADRTDANAKSLASIAPVCGTYRKVDMSPIAKANLPVWAFHAENDPTVGISNTYDAIAGILAHNPAVLPVTTYWPTGGHGIWTRAYDTTYNWGNPNLYEWMLAQDKSLPVNKRPVAKAGNDIIAAVGSTVTLDGSSSTDADGKIVRYVWNKVSGPTGGKITPEFSENGISKITSLQEGTYVFELKAIDDRAEYTTDQVTVTVQKTVSNKAPVAHAGADQSLSKESTSLDGSLSKDEDGSINSYKWSFVSGPNSYNLVSPTSKITEVKALEDGTYVFKLTVTDDKGATASDEVKLVVKLPAKAPAVKLAPVADAGKNQKVLGSTTTLDGSASFDEDGSIKKYFWEQLQGPAAVISSANTAKTNVTGLKPGNYVFRLHVWDNDDQRSRDDIGITVKAGEKPYVYAGKNQVIAHPQNSVTLDGSQSSDSEGSKLVYSWYMINGPSTYKIQSPATAVTQVTNLSVGKYIFRLKAYNEHGLSAQDDILITVNSGPAPSTEPSQENIPPDAYAGRNIVVDAPVSTVTLDGSASMDADGSIVTYEWNMINGPSTYKINSPASVTTTVTDLKPGKYIFRLRIWDDRGARDQDDILVTVREGSQLTTMAAQTSAMMPEVKSASTAEIKLFPNPATSQVNVQLSNNRTGTGYINIYDVNGKTVHKTSINKSGMEFQQTLQVNQLVNGMYYVEVVLDNVKEKLVSFIKNS